MKELSYIEQFLRMVWSNILDPYLSVFIVSIFASLIAAFIIHVIAKILNKKSIGKNGIDAVENFIRTSLVIARSFCEFNLDPEKDYVENSKKLISDNIPREYTRHLTYWRIMPRRTLKLAQVVKIATQTTKKGFVCALIGEPASGKTFEMAKIFAELAQRWKPGNPLPILIFVNSLSRKILSEVLSSEDPKIQRVVIRYLRESPGIEPEFPKNFVNLLEDKWLSLKPVLLFDAIDETPDKKNYEDLVSLIQKSAERMRNEGTIVISCREGDYSGRGNFVQLKILPLSHQQIIEHYKHADPKGWKVDSTLELPIAKNLSHYLTNVYFLRLFLDWGLDENRRDKLPDEGSIQDLFQPMFTRELKKFGIKFSGEEKYLQDALAPIAYVLTHQALPVNPMQQEAEEQSNRSPGLALYDPKVLGAIVSANQTDVKAKWRQVAGKYVEALVAGSKTDSLAVELVGEIGKAEELNPFLKEIQELKSWDTASLSEFVAKWINCWDPEPLEGERKIELPDKERKILAKEMERFLQQKQSDTERITKAFTVALTYRAIIWSIKAGLLRVDPENRYILAFRHQRIREYLTAYYIEATGFVEFLENKYTNNSWWQQTLNMLAAITIKPDFMLEKVLQDKSSRHSVEFDPERVLAAAQCAQYLPRNRRLKCQKQIGQICDALLGQAFQGNNPVNQVLALSEVGPMVSSDLIVPEDTLTNNLTALTQEVRTRHKALNALYAVLRIKRPSLKIFFKALFAIMLGMMYHDPEEEPQSLDKKVKRSRLVQFSLGFAHLTAWILRLLVPLAWAFCLSWWVYFAFIDPLRSLKSMSFWILFLFLCGLLWHRTKITGNWSFSLYQFLRFPLLLLIQSLQIIQQALRWLGKLMYEVASKPLNPIANWLHQRLRLCIYMIIGIGIVITSIVSIKVYVYPWSLKLIRQWHFQVFSRDLKYGIEKYEETMKSAIELHDSYSRALNKYAAAIVPTQVNPDYVKKIYNEFLSKRLDKQLDSVVNRQNHLDSKYSNISHRFEILKKGETKFPDFVNDLDSGFNKFSEVSGAAKQSVTAAQKIANTPSMLMESLKLYQELQEKIRNSKITAGKQLDEARGRLDIGNLPRVSEQANTLEQEINSISTAFQAWLIAARNLPEVFTEVIDQWESDLEQNIDQTRKLITQQFELIERKKKEEKVLELPPDLVKFSTELEQLKGDIETFSRDCDEFQISLEPLKAGSISPQNARSTLHSLENYPQMSTDLQKNLESLRSRTSALLKEFKKLRIKVFASMGENIAKWHNEAGILLDKHHSSIASESRPALAEHKLSEALPILTQLACKDIQEDYKYMQLKMEDTVAKLSEKFREAEKLNADIETQGSKTMALKSDSDRILDSRSIQTWWKHGGKLQNRLSEINREYKEITFRMGTLEPELLNDISLTKERLNKLSNESSELASLIKQVSARLPSPYIRKDPWAEGFMHLAEEIRMSELAARDLDRKYNSLTADLQSKFNNFKQIHSDVSAKIFGFKSWYFAAFLLDSSVIVVVIVLIGFIIYAALRGYRIGRFVNSFEKAQNRSEKRNFCLAKIMDEGLMSVRLVATRHLENLALDTDDDLKQLIKFQQKLELHGKRGDRICAGRLIDIAGDIKKRILRKL